jgi:hypothetical protein
VSIHRAAVAGQPARRNPLHDRYLAMIMTISSLSAVTVAVGVRMLAGSGT